jgi:diphosphomevalonate decarboxylase
VPVWFTLDAGPNPVLLTLASHEAEVERLARDGRCGGGGALPSGGDARLVEP